MLARSLIRNFSSAMPRALIAVTDGSEEMETVGVIDVLRRARVNVTVASIDKSKTIKTCHNISITADTYLKDCLDEKYDAVILPGGLPGADHFRDCPTLISLLKKQKEEGRIYAAICASPAVVFAHHHLIDGMAATCYPDEIKDWKDKKVVVTDNCITSQGPGTVYDFALQLVTSLCGEATSKKIASGMIYHYFFC